MTLKPIHTAPRDGTPFLIKCLPPKRRKRRTDWLIVWWYANGWRCRAGNGFHSENKIIGWMELPSAGQ